MATWSVDRDFFKDFMLERWTMMKFNSSETLKLWQQRANFYFFFDVAELTGDDIIKSLLTFETEFLEQSKTPRFNKNSISKEFSNFLFLVIINLTFNLQICHSKWIILLPENTEAGVTFDNSFFNNYFDFVRQLKNGSFLGPVFVHVTGWSKN